MAKKLYVGSLAWGTTDDSLGSFFKSIGGVASARVISDRMTGRSRGFGFVEMENDEDASRAIAELDGKELDGRAIRVSEAQESTGGERRGGFGGGNGGARRGGFDRGGDRGGYNNNRSSY